MSTLGPVNQLVATIATQLSRAAQAKGMKPAARKRNVRVPGKGGEHDLASLVALRVAGIDRDDPGRGRKAFRVFLEAVLLGQFGEHLVNDPHFQQLVDQVHSAIDADPQTLAMSQAAIAQLLQQPTTQSNQDKP